MRPRPGGPASPAAPGTRGCSRAGLAPATLRPRGRRPCAARGQPEGNTSTFITAGERIQVAAAEVEFLIHNHPGENLSRAAPQNAGLVMIDAEAFFEGDSGRMRGKPVDHAAEFRVP